MRGARRHVRHAGRWLRHDGRLRHLPQRQDLRRRRYGQRLWRADPLVNVLVYVPNAPVLPFAPGVSCDTCDGATSIVTGSPLVSTTTGVDGTFTLPNMPVGKNIPLVIQNGRWRRQMVIPDVASC